MTRRPQLDRKLAVRGLVIAVLLVFVVVAVPKLVGADWITTFTSVAIYSLAALGFGLLYGRVGLISLGQVALLSIGCWIGTRLAYATALPFPLLLLVVGGITCVIGVIVGLPALRLSGLYLALITLMFAGATTVVLGATDFPNGGHGFLGHTLQLEPDRPCAGPQAVGGRLRRRLLPLRRDRRCAHVPARARPRRGQARSRLGLDSRERAGGARGRREHTASTSCGRSRSRRS